jgi:hypothetical protein
MRLPYTVWVAAAVFGLFVGLPLAWVSSNFHASREAPNVHDRNAHKDAGNSFRPILVEIYSSDEDKAVSKEREREKAETDRDLAKATWAIAKLTFLLAIFAVGVFTYKLWDQTRELAKAAIKDSALSLAAAREHTQTLSDIERAYLVGGGQVAVAGTTFQIEFSNYGKTPAFIYAFDAQFSTLQEVQAGPQEVFPMFLFEDVIPPGGAGPHPQKKQQIKITVPSADVVYGAFWYEDWQKRVHIFRFILRIVPGVSMYGSTLTSVPGVDRSYMYRD